LELERWPPPSTLLPNTAGHEHQPDIYFFLMNAQKPPSRWSTYASPRISRPPRQDAARRMIGRTPARPQKPAREFKARHTRSPGPATKDVKGSSGFQAALSWPPGGLNRRKCPNKRETTAGGGASLPTPQNGPLKDPRSSKGRLSTAAPSKSWSDAATSGDQVLPKGASLERQPSIMTSTECQPVHTRLSRSRTYYR